MRVFVAGGTGLVGARLVRCLHRRQDAVVLLTRRPEEARAALGAACTLVAGDPLQPGPWAEAVDGCDAVVNLTGENLFNRRWDAAFKTVLQGSRVRSTENLVQALARKPGGPRVLVNASAVGYYGPRDEELTEDSPPGDDFLARLCVAWEKAARQAEPLGVRVAVVRIGVVLDRAGGALRQMLPTFQAGMGGSTGSGKQWVSWVHHADLTGILLLALDNPDARGPLNAMAPNPVTNADFARALGRALHRPAFLATPAFALRLVLGEVADVALSGQRVLPKRTLALGYGFQFPTLDGALLDVLKEEKAGSGAVPDGSL
jgi:uncharacterized protein (TIGR01777 family)